MSEKELVPNIPMSSRKRKQADVPAVQPCVACHQAGAVRRSADEESQGSVIDVRGREKAPSRQVPVEKEATHNNQSLRYGEPHAAGFLDVFLSDKRIIEYFCSERMKVASQRHDRQFFSLMEEGGNLPEVCQSELPILPGRRTWHKFRPPESERGTLGSRHPNHEALLSATLTLRRTNPDLGWNQNLQNKIDMVRSRVLRPDFSFESPKIWPVRKEKSEYRAIASFSKDDKLLAGQAARYFLREFDPLFSEASLAFRSKKFSDPRGWALERIIEFSRRYSAVPLYVAEADIMGFFDCVDHTVVRERVEALAHEGGIDLDPIALKILNAYLDVYSFPRTVKAVEGDLRARKGAGAYYRWPIASLRQWYADPDRVAIGVPQGGALSNVIVNVLLHFADVAVEQIRSEGHDLLYLRYCDDVIFVSASHEITRRAFEVYLEQLEELRLPVHRKVALPAYEGVAKREYWTTKTKAPFAWGIDVGAGQIPWIGFLGYELRRDGLLRIRASSIHKQKQKVVGIVGRAVRMLDQVSGAKSTRSLRVSAQSFFARVRGKMIAAAVGRVKIGGDQKAPLPCTFAAGFRALAGCWFPPRMFRDLDRHRERNIRRLSRRIEKVPPQKVCRVVQQVRVPRFLGRPFSYMGQFFSRK